MKNVYVVFMLILLLSVQNISAQGCSDAGICTIHSVKGNTEFHPPEKGNNNELRIGFGYAIGEQSINNYTWHAEYTRLLKKNIFIAGKINYASVTGELANTSGPGDLFLTVTKVLSNNNKWQQSLIAGIKVPLNGAGKIGKGIKLPMPYQTSLGTTDLLLGINMTRHSFGASLAWQQPVNSSNNNGFLSSDYPSSGLSTKYWSTNEFKRKSDWVVRLSYSIMAGPKISIRPGLLAIYHSANDSYVDENNREVRIGGSKGLTLNSNVFVHLYFKKGNGLALSIGAPFVTRDQRPDGLTRKFVSSLEYVVLF